MSDIQPEPEYTARFLESLVEGGTNALIMWRCIHDTKQPGKTPALWYSTYQESAERLAKLNAEGYGIFMQVNEGHGTKKKDITGVRALFVDQDHGDLPEYWPEGAEPTVVVQSGRGQHAYWLVSDGADGLKDHSTRQLNLASVMYTDDKIHDLSRIMRVPGFWWCKPGTEHVADWRMVTCSVPYKGDGAPRAARDVVTALTSPPKPPSSRWALYRLGCLASKVRQAPPGTSQNTWNIVCYEAKDYVRAGLLSEDEAMGILMPAAQDRRVDGIETTWQSACQAEGCFVAALDPETPDENLGVIFPTGHEEDLARTLVREWGGADGLAVVGGILYVYDPATGVWDPRSEEWLRGQVSLCHNRTYLTLAGNEAFLRVGVGLRTKVAQCILETPALQRRVLSSTPGVAFRNGFLTPSGDLVPLDSSQGSVYRLDWDWDGAPEGPGVAWERFFTSIWEDCPEEERTAREASLGALVGLSLLGLAPAHARVLLLHGSGANGKSVLMDALRGVLDCVVGEGLVAGVSPSMWGEAYSRYALKPPCRLNLVPELPAGQWLSADRFKSIVAGDVIDARLPYMRPVSFAPVAGHIMSCNELPGSADRSEGFWRRFVVLPLDQDFRGRATPARKLLRALTAPDVARRFVSWCVSWAIGVEDVGEWPEITREGGDDLIESWKLDNDPVALWIHDRGLERCEPNIDEALAARDAYTDFAVWSASSGFQNKSIVWFGNQLRRLGIKVGVNRRHKSVVRTRGLRKPITKPGSDAVSG